MFGLVTKIPLLLSIATAFANIISFLIKHPFVLKMMIFTIFTGVISALVIYIKSLVAPYIFNNTLLTLAAYFGLLDGLSLYLTIILAGFGAKQIVAFIRS